MENIELCSGTINYVWEKILKVSIKRNEKEKTKKKKEKFHGNVTEFSFSGLIFLEKHPIGTCALWVP